MSTLTLKGSVNTYTFTFPNPPTVNNSNCSTLIPISNFSLTSNKGVSRACYRKVRFGITNNTSMWMCGEIKFSFKKGAKTSTASWVGTQPCYGDFLIAGISAGSTNYFKAIIEDDATGGAGDFDNAKISYKPINQMKPTLSLTRLNFSLPSTPSIFPNVNPYNLTNFAQASFVYKWTTPSLVGRRQITRDTWLTKATLTVNGTVITLDHGLTDGEYTKNVNGLKKSNSYTITVVNNYGNSVSISGNFSTYTPSKPSISNIVAQRITESNIDKITLRFSYKIDECNQSVYQNHANIKNLKINGTIKEESSGTIIENISELVDISNGSNLNLNGNLNFEFNNSSNGYDPNKAYNISFQVEDIVPISQSGSTISYNISNTYADRISTSFYTLDIAPDGKGIGIGTTGREPEQRASGASSQLDIDTDVVNIHGYPVRHSVLVWSGGYYMTDSHTVSWVDTEEWYSITLVWSGYTTQVENYHWHSFTILRKFIVNHNGAGHNFILSGGSLSPIGNKYVYIYKDHITGHANNSRSGTSNGITYDSSKFVLREVWLNY